MGFAMPLTRLYEWQTAERDSRLEDRELAEM
jgi:hypothetical protein